MKRIILSLLAIICFSATYAQKSRVYTDSIESRILGGAKKYFSVYLPNGYDESKVARYPVVYLLHGAWGTHSDWAKQGGMQQTLDELIMSGFSKPMIVVMPDARGVGADFAGANMGYFNVTGWRYEDFFFQELIPTVDKRLRTKNSRESRAIAGLSMGGGGSVVYGLKHPDVFSAVGSLSGLLGDFPTSRSISIDESFKKSLFENSPCEILTKSTEQTKAQYRSIRWWLDCGDDDYLYRGNFDFYCAMRENNIPIEMRMRDGGHTWRYWTIGLYDLITFVSMGF